MAPIRPEDLVAVIPTPISVNMDTVRDDQGNQWIRFQISCVTGMFYFFLPPLWADQIGQDMQERAQKAKLLLPPGAVPPLAHPNGGRTGPPADPEV